MTVISTVTTQPPMVADELRRQADIFTDIVTLQSKIGRDPSERAAAVRRAKSAATRRSTRRNSCSVRRRRNGPTRPPMSAPTTTILKTS